MTTIIDAIAMCEDKINIHQAETSKIEAKINKNYDLADSIRKELEEKGIILKDTREGTTFEIM